MTDLQTLFDLATDEIESPDLARTALASAYRRRTHRRGAVAGLAAAVAVAGVVLVPRIVDSDPVRPPAEQPSTPNPSPSPSPSAEPDRVVTSPEFDPREVDRLPDAPADVAAALPDLLAPPSTAPPLADDPVEAGVVAFDVESALMVLSTDGSWRSVPAPDDYAAADLSRDGTRLVVETDTGADVWDLPDGAVHSVPTPNGAVDVDGSLRWVWLDDSTLLLADAVGGWRVDADSGSAERVAYPAGGAAWAVDERGSVVESAPVDDPPKLTDWANGSPRRMDLSRLGRFGFTLAVEGDVVASTTHLDQFSVVTADRRDLSLRAVLPIRDEDALYANGPLSVVGLLDDGTVLFRTMIPGPHFVLRIVAWDPGSGVVSLISRTTEDPGALTSIAIDALS